MRVAFRVGVAALVVAAMALMASGTGGAAPAPAPLAPVLGVLNAGAGSFDGHRIVLRKVQPNGVWFTDRPARQAGSARVAALVDRFFRGQEPPNAAVELVGASAKHDVAIVELSKPRYDRKSSRLTMNAKLVRTVSSERVARHPSLRPFASRNDGKLAKRFGAVAVFLDAAAPTDPTPDEAEVQELEDQLHTLNAQTETLIHEVWAQDTSACWITFLRTVIDDLYDLQPPIERNLVTLDVAVEHNNGDLPASDQALLASTKAALSTAQAKYAQLESDYTNAVKTKSCPATG
jgi:hypothetical protein